MPDIAAALAVPGLPWLVLTIAIAGIVRGFTGFGTALIFMPVAGVFLPTPEAVVAMAVTGMFSSALLVPRALRTAERAEVAVLAVAATLAIPLGVWALAHIPAPLMRWIVAGAATVTLGALVSGWRYRGRVTRPGLAGVGATAGVLGGMTGLTGPPVILFYLAGTGMAEVIRANTILFLAILDLSLAASLTWSGLAGVSAIALGLVLAVPYLLAVAVGQGMFRPGRETAYRRAAYAVIGGAILSGLPVWT